MKFFLMVKLLSRSSRSPVLEHTWSILRHSIKSFQSLQKKLDCLDYADVIFTYFVTTTQHQEINTNYKS